MRYLNVYSFFTQEMTYSWIAVGLDKNKDLYNCENMLCLIICFLKNFEIFMNYDFWHHDEC